MNIDPFICTICKSGQAGVCGEYVTVRWLESFANFSRRASQRVRVASGLFSALTGARGEREREDSDSLGEDNEEEEFIDSVEEGEISIVNRKFFIINFLISLFYLIFICIITILYRIEIQYIILNLVLGALIHSIFIILYFFVKFQKFTNNRRLGNNDSRV